MYNENLYKMLLWYLKEYGLNFILFISYLLTNLYNNKVILINGKIKTNKNDSNINHEIVKIIEPKKYEDKYLNEIKKMDKENEELIKELINKNNINRLEAIELLKSVLKDKLKNCFIIENTPLGNVLMCYNINDKVFEYYSDKTIPYKYLEVVSRKYVKQFNCICILMNENVEIEKKIEELPESQEKFQQKKNVFTKFKSYNKDLVIPLKNSIPIKKENTDIDSLKKCKTYTNVYVSKGKFANFNFLKKIDRKVIDKKFSITYADFKNNINVK